jgi:hypothetical protein
VKITFHFRLEQSIKISKLSLPHISSRQTQGQINLTISIATLGKDEGLRYAPAATAAGFI